MEKLKHNIYYINRWDIVREKRRDVEKMQREHEQKQLRKFWWIRQQKTNEALKVIFQVFDQTKTALYQEYKEKLFAKRIIRRFGEYKARIGPSFEDRACNQVRLAVTA